MITVLAHRQPIDTDKRRDDRAAGRENGPGGEPSRAEQRVALAVGRTPEVLDAAIGLRDLQDKQAPSIQLAETDG